MKEIKTTKTMIDFKTSETDNDAVSLLNLNVYKELDENPNQNLDLVTHIKNQLHQLQSIHQRKMFMIREIGAVQKRNS